MSAAYLLTRWGLAGLTVALCLWALVETFSQHARAAEGR